MRKCIYQNRARELKRLWKVITPTNIIPIVVGAQGTSKSLQKNLKTSGTTVSIELLHNAALLHEYSERNQRDNPGQAADGSTVSSIKPLMAS